MTVEEDEALAAVPGSSVAEDRDRRRLRPGAQARRRPRPSSGLAVLVGRGDDSDQKISSHATYTAAKKPSLTIPSSNFQSHTNVQPFSALGRLIRNRGQETLRRPGRWTDRGLS